ncbi:hypothetical protein ACFLWG_02955 [Chloroflexota bacterium]
MENRNLGRKDIGRLPVAGTGKYAIQFPFRYTEMEFREWLRKSVESDWNELSTYLKVY